MFDYNLSVTLVTVLLSILIFWRSLVLRKNLAKKTELLQIQTQKIAEIRQELKNSTVPVRDEDFQASLKQAKVTTELQKPRNSFVYNPNGTRSPERYNYLQNMLHAGVPKEEIASTLGMSDIEISQILKLSKLCCGIENGKNTPETFSPA